MKITKAAIKFRYDNAEYVIEGWRHSDIYWEIHERFGYSAFQKEGTVEGFTTDTGEFFNRIESMKIARAAGQTSKSSSVLYSEDLW